MRSPLPDYLTEVLRGCADSSGTLADYIPELARADPDRFALTLVTAEGAMYSVGDDDTEFTIQSISKPSSTVSHCNREASTPYST